MNKAAHSFSPTRTTWPHAVAAAAFGAGPSAKAGRTTTLHAPGTPVWVRPGTGQTALQAAAQVKVKVLDHSVAAAAGIHGMLFTVNGAAGATADSKVRIGVDYSAFAQAEGGDFGSRLALSEAPSCILTTPTVRACRTLTPLASQNDAKAETVSAPVHLTGMVLAAAADTGGDGGGSGGTYAATSLAPSGSWAQSGSSGSFTYDYPITVAPARGTLSPSVGLHYDSGSVDGRTAGTQAQSSWVGDGWTTPESYVEQSFVTCADSPEGTASPAATGDNCYDGPILTLSLNGSSTALVWDSGKNTWKEQSDDGAIVTHVTGSNNGTGTYNTDYWKVTSRNGTVYQFGRNQLPGWASGKAVTNSVQSGPVYSAHSGDPCYSSSGFSSSVCTMAYRWNLDYVTDVHSNAMAYYYKTSTNYYGEDNGKSNVSYVRDAYLSHVDYGFTDGGAYGTVPAKVTFTTGDRCVTGTCQPLNSADAKYWPDVPFSDICASGTTCSMHAPSFFSTVRLTAIAAQQWSTTSSSYVTVDSYALTQTIPATGDGGAVTPTLWLSSVQHTGSDTSAGATSSTALPTVTFAGDQYQNRTDTSSLPAFYRFRLSAITTETGSVIGVNYTLANPCSTPVTISPSANTSSCYPVSWTPTGYSAPITDWFNKYVVSLVTQTDPTGGAPAVSTSYVYKGGAAWHYDDNEEVKSKYRTYGQFRGYGDVQTKMGDSSTPQTLTETTYYRGMSKDNNSTVVTLTDSQGGKHEDLDQLAGQELESSANLGSGGPIDHSTISSYWVSAATATRSRTGLPDLTANRVEPVEQYTRQAVTGSGATTWRYTETDHSYDSSTSSATFGLEKVSYQHTTPVNSAYDRCSVTTYAAPDTGENLVGLQSEIETDTVACGGYSTGSSPSVPASTNSLTAPSSVSRPAQVISDVRTFYDDPSFSTTFPQATAPAKGDTTMVRTATTYSGSAFTYQTSSRATYDSYGRKLKAYDANGNLTTTTYTDNSVGLTTGTTTANALSQTTSNTLDPERGISTSSSDLNHVVTTTRYDALGRATSVWLNSRPTSSPANYLYSYQVAKNSVAAATTQKMNEAGGYVPSVTLYDGLMRVRETQAWTPQAGRMITENLYDSRGWVFQKNDSWWDSKNSPSTTLVTGAISAIPKADVYTFDGLGRTVVDTSQKDGVTVDTSTTVYNGDRTTVIPPSGGTVVRTLVDPLGRSTEIDQYTAAPTVNTPSNTFTGIWSVTAGSTTRTTYGYDGHSSQSTVTDDTGAAWSSTFNLLGQVTSKLDPDAGTSSMVYDGNGNLTQTTDSRGQVTSTRYDALNRKTAEYAATTAGQTSSNELDSWVYDNSNNAVAGMSDALGHVTTETSYWGGAAYTVQQKNFNVFGESLGETVTIPASTEGSTLGTSYVFGHTYTTNTGLPNRDSYPAAGGLPAENVTHSYQGAADLPDAIGYADGTTYDAYGRVQQVILNSSPNQAFVTDSYDPHTGLLDDTLVTSRAGSAPVATDDEQTYGYDAAHNLTRQTDTRSGSSASSETQCYRYDAVQRLTAAWTATDSCAATPSSSSHGTVGDNLGSASAYWTTWSFNTLGERTTQVQHSTTGGTDTTTTSTYNGNGAGQPHTLTSTATTGGSTSSSSYHYDSTGEMSTRNAAQGSQSLTWNAAGLLTAVTAGSTTSTYKYDADGSLLIQKDPTSTTLYLPHEQITLDTSANTTSGVRYQTEPGGVIAYRNGTTSSTYGYEMTDQHGTPYLRLDNTAQVPSWRQLTPYGAPRGTTGPSPDNRTFLNKTTDATTGLTEIGARSYDPSTGSFVTLDPILDTTHPQELNGYSYSGDNPVTFSDPSGLEAGSWCDDSACAILNGQSQTSYPMETMVNGKTHARPAPNISPDVYATAVIETYAKGQLSQAYPGSSNYVPTDPNGAAEKMYLAARTAYIAAHAGGGLHTMPVPSYVNVGTGHRPTSQILGGVSFVTGVLAFGLTITGVAAPAGAAVEAGSLSLGSLATGMEVTSLATGGLGTILDCHQKLASASCGLDFGTLAVGAGGQGAVLRLDRIAEEAGAADKGLAEMTAQYTDVGKSNVEFGLSVGNFANSAGAYFADGASSSPAGMLIDNLGYGNYLLWR